MKYHLAKLDIKTLCQVYTGTAAHRTTGTIKDADFSASWWPHIRMGEAVKTLRRTSVKMPKAKQGKVQLYLTAKYSKSVTRWIRVICTMLE